MLALLVNNHITINHFINNNTSIRFLCKKEEEKRIHSILEKQNELSYHYHLVSRISLIGNGIVSNHILNKVMNLLDENYPIFQIENSETKLSITFSKLIEDSIANQLHDSLILE